MSEESALRREYKAVAMPKSVRGRRRRGKTRGDFVADAVADILNREADAGWRYVRSDVVHLHERAGLFGALHEVVHTVLVFERPIEAPARNEVSARPAAARREVGLTEAPAAVDDHRRAATALEASPREARAPLASDDRLAVQTVWEEGRGGRRRRDARMAARHGDAYGFQSGGDRDGDSRAARVAAELRAGGGRLSAGAAERDEDDQRRAPAGRGLRRAEAERRDGVEAAPGAFDSDLAPLDGAAEGAPRYRGLVETMVHSRGRRGGER